MHVRVFFRGVQLYLFLLAILSIVTIAWGTNRFVLNNQTTAAGWPVLLAIGISLATVGAILRSVATPARRKRASDYPWN